MTELATLVTQVLESNQEMSRRMARLEQQNYGRSASTIHTTTARDAVLGPSATETNVVEDNESILTIRRLIPEIQNASNDSSNDKFGFTFDQDLSNSRPYTRALKRHTVWSAASSEIQTMGSSYLSGLSLSDVSHISVINLLFSPQDLWNGQHYDRVGFFLSKSSNNSSTKSPTSRNSRAGQRGRNLSKINEYTDGLVATRNVSLLGVSSALITEEAFDDSPVLNQC